MKVPRFKEPLWLNLGCGNDKTMGWLGIDIRDCGQEVIWDLRNGIPFPDESAEKISSVHFLEHLDDNESKALFKEIYRVLKKEGITAHRLPHQQDPTAYYTDHKTFWNEARVNTLNGVPGLEDFKVIENKKVGGELFFTLQKNG